MNIKEKHNMRLIPISAVHVGSGNTIDRMEYTLRERGEGLPAFLRFYPEKIVEDLVPKEMETFNNLIESNNLLGLSDFFGEHRSKKARKYLGSTTQDFFSEYEDRKNSLTNRLEIEEQYRAQGQASPIIPGSSIKGALRTAILNEQVEILQRKEPQKIAQYNKYREKYDTKFQKEILHYTSPNDDPFRLISIEDCIFTPIGTQLVGRLMQYKPFSKKAEDFDTTAIFAEVIRGKLSGSENSANFSVIFDSSIKDSIVPESKALKYKIGQKLFNKKIYLKELLEASDKFYQRLFDDEYNKFYLDTNNSYVRNGADELAGNIDNMKTDNRYLIRIGRWSHIEAVSIKGLVNPRARHGFGKTRTLFKYDDIFIPMGWCYLELME